MDPASALGVASAIIQLLDFTAKLTKGSYNLIATTKDWPQQHQQLLRLGKLSKDISQALLDDLKSRNPLPEDEARLQQTLEASDESVDALCQSLNALNVTHRPDGSDRFRSRLTTGVKAFLSRDTIESQIKNLEGLNERISGNLLSLIRRHQVLQHDELLSCIDRHGVQSTELILAVKQELLNSTHTHHQAMIQDATKGSKRLHGALEGMQLDLARNAQEHARRLEQLGFEQERILQTLSNASVQQRCNIIIESLAFPGMNHRRDTVPESSRVTLGWVYDQDSTFQSWLQSEDSLFCIFGKPGSGKSTLMGFLDHDDRTRLALRAWRPGSTLITASHYFWYSGQAAQRSHNGLLRSLLHGIIARDPVLACCLCSQRWQDADKELGRPWTRENLLACLQNVSKLHDAKVFLLIDGLDEYYPHDNHRMLINDLRDLQNIPNLKMCVSSRPWPIFQSAFSSLPSLNLSEENHSDIRAFAWEQISISMDIASDSTADQLSKWLVDEIDRLAEGVFLWAYLAVRAVSERLQAGCDEAQVIECLLTFPKDLEEYFHEMIYKRISSTWREGADTACALMLAIRLAERKVYPWENDFLVYWGASKGKFLTDPDFARKQPIQHITSTEREQMVRETRLWLGHCARDLLVMSSFEGRRTSRVEFSHRTVHDFVKTSSMLTVVEKCLPVHFSSPEFVSRLFLFQTKFIEAGRRAALLAFFLSFWRYLELGALTTIENIAELDNIAYEYVTLYCTLVGPNRGVKGSLYSSRATALLFKALGFLVINNATRSAQVVLYALNTQITPRMAFVSSLFISSFFYDEAPDHYIPLLRWFLAAGLNVNAESEWKNPEPETIWRSFMQVWVLSLLSPVNERDTQYRPVMTNDFQWFGYMMQCAELMLEYGADMQGKVCWGRGACGRITNYKTVSLLAMTHEGRLMKHDRSDCSLVSIKDALVALRIRAAELSAMGYDVGYKVEDRNETMDEAKTTGQVQTTDQGKSMDDESTADNIVPTYDDDTADSWCTTDDEAMSD